MPPTTPTKPADVSADRQLVTFTKWHSGYRAGEVAGFPPDEAAKLIEAKVAEPHITEEQRGKAEAAALKAQAAAEKEAKEVEAKAKAEADEKAKKEADDSKKGRG